jgi:hypothetical protein
MTTAAKTQSASVTVAEAMIRQTVSITPLEVHPVNLKVGETLRIRVKYHFEEALKEKEEYIFTLKCESSRNFTAEAASHPPPITLRFGDKWGRNDKGEGVLEQPFKFDKVGEYAVRFEVDVEYLATPWGDARVVSDQRKSRGGTLRVHVTAA